MDDCILALYCVLCIILLIIINRLDRLENRLHTLIKGNQNTFNRDKLEAEEIDTKLDEAIKHYEELSKERYLFNPHNKDLYEWLKELRDRRMEN